MANIILFIDELHTHRGCRAGGDSSLDAGNMLKPALARGELARHRCHHPWTSIANTSRRMPP